MTELEQRLTNELSKLAEQYEQDQKRLAEQQASDLNGYIEWSKRTGEHLDNFSGYANTLAERYNEMIRLMERRWL